MRITRASPNTPDRGSSVLVAGFTWPRGYRWQTGNYATRSCGLWARGKRQGPSPRCLLRWAWRTTSRRSRPSVARDCRPRASSPPTGPLHSSLPVLRIGHPGNWKLQLLVARGSREKSFNYCALASARFFRLYSVFRSWLYSSFIAGVP